MIKEISEEQFRKLYTPVRAPHGSLLRQAQRQWTETHWFADDATHRIGTIVYDSYDHDWQAISLEDRGSGYRTHEARASMATEREAIEALFKLFSCESGTTQALMDDINAQAVHATGLTAEEILLAPRFRA